jgi:hypothetical protein
VIVPVALHGGYQVGHVAQCEYLPRLDAHDSVRRDAGVAAGDDEDLSEQSGELNQPTIRDEQFYLPRSSAQALCEYAP